MPPTRRKKDPRERTVVAFDVGGTFTDIVVQTAGGRLLLKVFTDAENPVRAVREALGGNIPEGGPDLVLHGTTLATNTLLEKKGARVALLTTRGFEDVLEIGHQNRPSLYEIQVTRPAPLVPRTLRIGIGERTLADGTVQVHPNPEEVRQALRRILSARAGAVAVCFLHSPLNPANEREAGKILDDAPLPFTLSHEVAPVQGEYERTAATVANAYLLPVMERYLQDLSRAWPRARVRIMHSGGGLVSATTASRLPVVTALSGPAAGVAAAFRAAEEADIERIITLDMGGTSTDVCLCDGGIPWTEEASVGEIPLPTSTVDIVTVGSGGGSIASIDPGGALRVGPESAGARPGPVSYGRGGTRPTLTDAHVLLGRIPRTSFLGDLRAEPLTALFRGLGSPVGLDPIRAAAGVLEVADTIMEGALRRVSVERGHDPREFTLVAFGGAAGLHACTLAERLRIPRVLVPPHPGLLCAFGLVSAGVVREASVSILKVLGRGIRPGRVEALARRLQAALTRTMSREEGVPASSIHLETILLLRYAGQSGTLPLPFRRDPVPAFHRAHRKRYGYERRDHPVELVRLLVRGSSKGDQAHPLSMPPDSLFGATTRRHTKDVHPGAPRKGRVWFREGFLSTPILPRSSLRSGRRFTGPLVVVEYSSTLVIPPGFSGSVDPRGNLLLHRPSSGPRKGKNS